MANMKLITAVAAQLNPTTPPFVDAIVLRYSNTPDRIVEIAMQYLLPSLVSIANDAAIGPGTVQAAM